MINKYIKFSKPLIKSQEINSVVETLKSGWLTTGVKTKLFEDSFRKYKSSKYAIDNALPSIKSFINYSDKINLEFKDNFFDFVIAIGVELSWQQVGLLLIATTLSISVPAAPGYLGTYHAVVIYMMVSVFDMDLAISQSLAIILHAVGFIPFVILGAWFFAKSSIQLTEIKNV